MNFKELAPPPFIVEIGDTVASTDDGREGIVKFIGHVKFAEEECVGIQLTNVKKKKIFFKVWLTKKNTKKIFFFLSFFGIGTRSS